MAMFEKSNDILLEESASKDRPGESLVFSEPCLKHESLGSHIQELVDELSQISLDSSENYKFLPTHLQEENGAHSKSYLATKAKQSEVLEKIILDQGNVYFLQLVARSLYEEVQSSGNILSEYFKVQNQKIPFMVDKDCYALYSYSDNPELIISPAKESAAITELLNELQVLEQSEEYKSVKKLKDDIVADFGTFSEADNWPYEMYDKYTKEYEVEVKVKIILKKLLNFFFEDGTVQPIPSRVFHDSDLSESESESENLFSYYYLPEIKEQLRIDFGEVVDELSLREQFYFFKLVSTKSGEEIKKIIDFIEEYQLDGFRTFLSLEKGDGDLGPQIIDFGRQVDNARIVFKYYGELLDSAEKAEMLVTEVSGCEGEACVTLTNQVRENILNRAQKDLEKAVRTYDPSEVEEQIENYVVKAKEYVALLQEVGAGKIESVSPESLSEEDRSRMQNLLQANYRKAYPDHKDDAFKAVVAASLVKSFSNPDTTFRILRDNNKIISYNRFDTLRDYSGREISYFGSFNADPAYSGAGGIMLGQTIKDELESGRPIMAHCDPTQPITKKYIEDGFIATQFYELSGNPSFEIWRSNDSSAQLESKDKTFEDLVSMANESQNIILRATDEQETYPELRYGNVLTRYLTHQGETFLVFEKIPEKLRQDFIAPQEELEKVD